MLALQLGLIVTVTMVFSLFHTMALAQTPPPTSCPIEGPVPTPPPGSPAAPSDVTLLGGVLSWTDNSGNEDGFLICVEPGGFEFVVGANVTNFTPPPDAPPNCPSTFPGDESANYTIYAFNEEGLSNFDSWSIIVECAVTPEQLTPTAVVTPTATELPPAVEPTLLPAAGAGASESNSPTRPLWPLLAVALAALLAVVALGRRYISQ